MENVPPSVQVESSEHVKDMDIQLQHLLLSSDPIVQHSSSKTTDDYLEQLAPILKEALKTDSTDALLEHLDNTTKEKDREIDAICSGDHNEYMDSVQQLGQVTSEANHIKSKVTDLSTRLNQSGQYLLERKNELIECRRVKGNVESAIDAVSACLQVLNLTNNVHELLQEKRKFAALKSLDDLQNVHLKEVSNFGFAQLINKSVPALTKMVKNDTITDIEKWLNDNQHMNGVIGKEAFDYVEQMRRQWKAQCQKNPALRRYKFNSPVEKSYRDGNGDDFFKGPKEKIDFSHLYECVLVHSSMSKADEFQHHFETDRKIHKDYLIPQSLSFKNANGDDDLAQFESVLRNIAGFCIIDRMISRQIPSLRPVKEIEDIWESLSQKLSTVLSTEIENVSGVETIRKIKSLLGNFLHAMQNAGYNTKSIQPVLLTLFNQYSRFLRQTFDEHFQSTLQKDPYMPMQINKPELYSKIVQVAWYQPDEHELKSQFPRYLPFSDIYPLCCAEIQTFLNHHESFLDDLPYDLNKIEDTLRNNLDDLLMTTVCKALEDKLRSTTREQVVQILVNLEYFETASENLTRRLSEDRFSGRRGKVVLEATQAFKRARKKAEERVFELVNTVVDDFLGLADYDWNTTVRTDQPSSYLEDMVSFLKTLVSSTLVNLPHSVKSFVYFDAFDHLASSLLRFLLDASDTTTFEALHNFNVDVTFLEEFINEIASDANNISLTQGTVTELRQCVNLILSDDMTEYNNIDIRMRKYTRVKPETAQLLFGKVHYARSLIQHDEGSESPQPNSSNSTTNSPSSKLMKYYRTSVEKLNDKMDRDHK
ncbi:hypothetical protein TRICI_005270 [Trichomonascus ciferrii]|uniref:Exocyst complex component SEC15 n=1 Tax=Trichomonascus ciferrii TaxID=44093 RepID=A0A642UU02_9ASCO|nr:hypothetical protein TRICI_005270 [Trichomonascus ciferrii]